MISIIEIILVDDGSPDSCGQICDQWTAKDSRIHVIHKENGGLSDARNKGMEKASGSYVAFVDSDDLIEPKYIEYLYRAILETDADFSECMLSKFSDEPKKRDSDTSISPIRILTQDDILYRFCNGTMPYNYVVWNKLYKRELIKDIYFAYGFQAEDVLFSCQVFAKSRQAAHIDNALYNYRIRQDSLSI